MAIERKKLEAHQLPAESMGIQHELVEIRISPATMGIKDDEKPLEKQTHT